MSEKNYDSVGDENERGAYLGDGKFEKDPVPTEAGEGGEWVCSVEELIENLKWLLGI